MSFTIRFRWLLSLYAELTAGKKGIGYKVAKKIYQIERICHIWKESTIALPPSENNPISRLPGLEG